VKEDPRDGRYDELDIELLSVALRRRWLGGLQMPLNGCIYGLWMVHVSILSSGSAELSTGKTTVGNFEFATKKGSFFIGSLEFPSQALNEILSILEFATKLVTFCNPYFPSVRRAAMLGGSGMGRMVGIPRIVWTPDGAWWRNRMDTCSLLVVELGRVGRANGTRWKETLDEDRRRLE